MALVTNFKNFMFASGLQDTEEDVLVCDADKTFMIIGLDIANILNTGVEVEVIFYDDSLAQNFSLVKNAPIPVGSSLQVISKQKHVLEPNDKIIIKTNLDDSVNVVGSYMSVYLS